MKIMKKFKAFMVMAAMAATATVVTSCSYGDDIDNLKDRMTTAEGKITTLEQQVATANTNIASLQTLVDQLSKAEYVTNVTENSDGYTLTFRSGKTATITNGVDGHSPLVGVKQEGDIWYWTVDGEWMKNVAGEKIKASAVTPQLRISETTNEWEVSLDEGKTWTSLGVKATGEKGDAFFKSVVSDNDKVTVTLVDGTVIELPLFDTFKKIRDRVQSIVYVPEYADGMIAVEEGKDVTIAYSVMPAEIATAIADNKANLSLTGKEVKTRAEAASLTIKDVKGDAKTGKLTVTATAKNFVDGQYYAFALTFSDGVSAYQTAYTTAFSIVEAESIRIGVLGLQAGMDTVTMGSYLQLFVVWNPGYTTNKDLTWSSSDEKRALVDQNGFVTVPSDAEDGNVTITAKTVNGKEASIVLTIADKKINVNTDQLNQNQAE